MATKPMRPRAFTQAIELQEILVNEIKNPATKAAVKAVCARTWEILEERKRVLRMKPLPKSVDVTTYRKARKPKSAPPPNFIPIAIPESSQVGSQDATPILPEAGSESSSNAA